MKTRVVQKAVILDKDNRMLMVRRSKTDVRRPLQWDLPGGLLEENEELLTSIAREITEETGLNATDFSPIYSMTDVRTWHEGKTEHVENVVFIFYLARTKSTEVKLSFEHDTFQWKPMEEALEEFEYERQKTVLKHIVDNQLLT